MRISNLELFCEVIEEESISKVAKKRFITQPAITKQIRQLENLYKVNLFERNNGHLFVTREGKELYSIAKKIAYQYNQSFQIINELNGQEYSNLTIGASYTIGEYILPKTLGKFKQEQAGLNISLKVSSTPTILNSLKENQISFGLVEGKVEDKDFKIKKFAEDELVVVCSQYHPLRDSNKNLFLEDLRNEKFIWREKNSGLRTLLEDTLREKVGVEELGIYMELGSNQAIKGAVEADLGVAILSRLIVKNELEYGTLSTLNIDNFTIQRDLWLVYRKDHYIKKTEQTFLDFLMR